MPTGLHDPRVFARFLQTVLPSCNATVPQTAGVALSGGPDSTALTCLLHRHAQLKLQPRLTGVTALIIDHGLRQDSLFEAQKVGKWMQKLGIAHQIKSIPWGTPPFPDHPGCKATEGPARTARIIVYKRFLRENGLKHLYLGHHLDDMVETALLRQARGTTSALALPGLKPIVKMPLHIDPVGPEDENLRLIRPLLQITKADLVAFCQSEGLNYVKDPTNDDKLYTKRNAVRHAMSALHARPSSRVMPSTLEPMSYYRTWAMRLDQRRTRLEAILVPVLAKVEWEWPVTSAARFHPRIGRSLSPEIRQLLLARIARSASPDTGNAFITPANMQELDNRIFGHRALGLSENRPSINPGAGVEFRHSIEDGCWTVSRQKIRQSQRDKLTYQLSSAEWRFWDNRFWIRRDIVGGCIPTDSQVWVKPVSDWTIPRLFSTK